MLIRYGEGAGLGWHRDRPVFGDVIGISLLAPAPLRFRRKAGREVAALHADRRAALDLFAARPGPQRMGAQHPAGRGLRYSITFRTEGSVLECGPSEGGVLRRRVAGPGFRGEHMNERV